MAVPLARLNRLIGFLTILAGALALTGLAGCSPSESQIAREVASFTNEGLQKPSSDCTQPGQIKLLRASGEVLTVATIQEAIDQSVSGDQIQVTGGVFSEGLRLSEKSGLTISSYCGAKIKSINFSKAQNVRISGLTIDARQGLAHGLTFQGGANSSRDITVESCEVLNAPIDFDGVWVGNQNQNLTFRENVIRDNAQNGFRFVGSGGPHRLESNIVTLNGFNGVEISGAHSIMFEKNLISLNGKPGSPSGNGYGIKAVGSVTASELTLKDNTIVLNNGKIIKNKSSQDLSGNLLDATDSGNFTTAGTEGTGVGVSNDHSGPVITFSQQAPIFTNQSEFTTTLSVTDQTPTKTQIFLGSLKILESYKASITATVDLADGANQIRVVSTDGLGNSSEAVLTPIVLDRQAPLLSSELSDNLLTNTSLLAVPLHVQDLSPTTTRIFLNETLVGTDSSKDPIFQSTLQEGMNQIRIECEDAAGNHAAALIYSNLKLDSTRPILSDLIPQSGTLTTGMGIHFSGKSNEQLKTVTFDAAVAVIAEDGLSFSGVLNISGDGEKTIDYGAKDLAGNLTSGQIQITVDNTPPGPFTILGVRGGGDLVFDQWLGAGTSPEIAWTPSVDALRYDVAIRNVSSGEAVCDSIQDIAGIEATLGHCNLAEGTSYKIVVAARDLVGNQTSAINNGLTFLVDRTAPLVQLLTPDNQTTGNSAFDVQVQVTESSGTTKTAVYQNDLRKTEFQENGFVYRATLQPGINVFRFESTDVAGNVSQSVVLRNITFDNVGPTITITQPDEGASIVGPSVTIRGSSNENLGGISFENQAATISADRMNFQTTMTFAVPGGQTVRYVARDLYGNISTGELKFSISAPEGNGPSIPPDPVTIAPPLNPMVRNGFLEEKRFLVEGENPVQTVPNPNVFNEERVGMIRGRVLDRSGAPLVGVKVSFLDHPDFGFTFSRYDGAYDLLANGGGTVTLVYEKPGFLTSHRKSNLDWNGFANPDDVVLVALDPAVTTVQFDAATTVPQIARGSTVTDSLGTRRGTLIFNPGTIATLVFPDGHTEQKNSLNVRVTEYTFGTSGPKAMPGELPPASAYTYAVELSTDEAIATGATEVRFDKRAYYYIENYFGFETGTIIPAGFFDRQVSRWIPSENGIVIKIVGYSNGLAQIGLDERAVPADDLTLERFGFSIAERKALATTYQVGETIWRTPVTHFTPWDCNMPFRLPADAVDPAPPQPILQTVQSLPNYQCGSIIEVENRALGERVEITEIESPLVYNSKTQAGSKYPWAFKVPITASEIPASLLSVSLRITIEGRELLFKEYPPASNLIEEVKVPAIDSFGRQISRPLLAEIRIGYRYPWMSSRLTDAETMFLGPIFGRNFWSDRERLNVLPGTREIFSTAHIRVGIDQVNPIKIGGWSFSNHHYYDDLSGTLYQGDGSTREVSRHSAYFIERSAGNGSQGYSGDGGSALNAALGPVRDLDLNMKGDLFLGIGYSYNSIRKISDGLISTFYWLPRDGYNTDISDIAVVETGFLGNDIIALANSGNGVDFRIYRIKANGQRTTIAGGGSNSIGQVATEGALATTVKLPASLGLTVDGSGNIYFATSSCQSGGFACKGHIYKLAPDGRVWTFAGNLNPTCTKLDGSCPATSVGIASIDSVLASPSGEVFFIQNSGYLSNYFIYRVSTDGRIFSYAGLGPLEGATMEGQDVSRFKFRNRPNIEFDNSGRLIISTGDTIWRVDGDRTTWRIAGPGQIGNLSDTGLATNVRIAPEKLSAGPDGAIYFYDTGKIKKLSKNFHVKSNGEFIIANEAGNKFFVFDRGGRHLSTNDARTGSALLTFEYDSVGRLISFFDGNQNATTIERNASGDPVAIIGPYGSRTTLTLNPHGYLNSIVDPSGKAYQFTYHSGGLLASFQDPRGATSFFDFDEDGFLLKDTDQLGGFLALAKVPSETADVVSATTAMGRMSYYSSQKRRNLESTRSVVGQDGTTALKMTASDGKETSVLPNGTKVEKESTPDARFGMQAPFTSLEKVTTPTGLVRSTSLAQAFVASPSNALLPKTLTWTQKVGTKTTTVAEDWQTKTAVVTTPAGRKIDLSYDSTGRMTGVTPTGIQGTQYTFDSRGRLSQVSVGSRTTGLQYDSSGRVSVITDPLNRQKGFQYDADGRVIREILPGNRSVSYSRDDNGNITSVTPLGSSSHSFTFNPLNLLSSYFAPTAVSGEQTATTYHFNLDKQMDQIMRPDGKVVYLNYDPVKGRLNTIASVSGGISFGYGSSTGQLIGTNTTDNVATAFTFDGFLPTSMTWSGPVAGAVSVTYNSDFLPVTQTVGGSTIGMAYDLDGLLIQSGDLAITRSTQNNLITGSALGGVSDSWTHNSIGEPTNYRAKYSTSTIFNIDYTRDNGGRITQKTETIGGMTSTFVYGYDNAGRLSSVSKNGTVIAAYVFDSNSNRLTHATLSGTRSGAYDAQDRLTSYGDFIYTYTANGEMKTKKNNVTSEETSYEFDVFGNLKRVSLPGGDVIDYLVDGQNRRVARKLNGAIDRAWLYQSDLQLVAELDASGAVISRFVYGTKPNIPDYVVKGGVSYRIVSDHLGSPRLVVNAATGEIVQRLDFDEFGVVIQDTNPGFTPFGFAGGLYEGRTGLVRFGAREYSADIGRWIQRDPILFGGGDINLYSYTWNDPINFFDPWGLAGITAEQGRTIANTAKGWSGTPYKKGGTTKGASGGADCSHSTHEIYKEAGFTYNYSPTANFANNPQFAPVIGDPQVGDVGLYAGHMVIYDPSAGNSANVWSANSNGYGPGNSSWYGTPKWYRLNAPAVAP